jgi:hypothetical protein
MWEYTNRRDPTRLSSDELREAEIDDSVSAVSNIKKKVFVAKIFGAVAFSKTFPAPRYTLCLSRMFLFYSSLGDQGQK